MATKRKTVPKFKGKAVARVGHLASRAGATKKEGMGVVKLARQVARGSNKPTANGSSARATIYQEGRAIRKESGRKAAMQFNRAVARVEKNTQRKIAARKAGAKPVTRKPMAAPKPRSGKGY
jgi:hypothetical protein